MKVIICGAGQVGTTIARHLAMENIDVTIIDIDENQVRTVDESYDVRGIVGHASHPKILEKAGTRNADMLIAVTRSDEVNMVACQVAYSLFNVKKRIARLRHAGYIAQHGSGLYAAEHLPIDIIISPELEIAEGIARRLWTPGAFDMVQMAEGRVELLGIHTEATDLSVVGKPFNELAREFNIEGMSILAVVRRSECFVPDADDRLEIGDDLYVLVKTECIDEVMAAFKHREKQPKKVVIVGGGNIGIHLAKRIKDQNRKMGVTVVENNRERAEYIARELGVSTIVLHGDALDRALLNEAQVGSSDTVITVTNDDETNIFVAVLAKQAGCDRAITLVNKRSYEALLPTLGIDAVVSPSSVTISTVLRHVRHDSISALYTLREDFGEVVEAELTLESRMIDKQVGELDLPRGMKLGAVVRGAEVIIPQPETILRAGDRVVALVAYSALRLAEALLGAKRKSLS